MTEKIVRCPFKTELVECTGDCEAHDLVVEADELDDESARYLSARDNPLAALSSKYFRETYDEPQNRLLDKARKRCKNISPLERRFGLINKIKSEIVHQKGKRSKQ